MMTSHIETLLYVQTSLNRLLRSDGIRNCAVGVIDIPFLLLVYLLISLRIYRYITAIVVSGQLFNERTNAKLEKILSKL